MQKKNANNQRSQDDLTEIIYTANLVPFSFNLESPIFKSSDNPTVFLENLLDEWKNYPELIDYLNKKTNENLTHNQNFSQEEYLKTLLVQFEEIKKSRQLLKILISFGEDYRNYLEKQSVKAKQVESLIENIPNSLKRTESDESKGLMGFLKGELISRFSISNKYDGAPNWWTAALNPNETYLINEFFKSAVDYMIFTVNDQHGIEIKFEGFLKLVLGSDLRRFRKCKFCEKMFWAKRLDAETCSKKCSDLIAQRRIRNNPERLELIKQRRRKKYQMQKGQQELEKEETKKKLRQDWLKQDFSKRD